MKTLQQAADKIARHLFKQKEQCVIGNRCKYRIEKSGRLVNRCAVGCLIDKKHYREALEGKAPSFFDREVLNVLKISGYDTSDNAIAFYRKAQTIHDENWENRNAAFEKLCAEYDLQYNPE